MSDLGEDMCLTPCVASTTWLSGLWICRIKLLNMTDHEIQGITRAQETPIKVELLAGAQGQ